MYITNACSEPCQTCKIESFSKTVKKWKLLISLNKISILHVSEGSEQTSVLHFTLNWITQSKILWYLFLSIHVVSINQFCLIIMNLCFFLRLNCTRDELSPLNVYWSLRYIHISFFESSRSSKTIRTLHKMP